MTSSSIRSFYFIICEIVKSLWPKGLALSIIRVFLRSFEELVLFLWDVSFFDYSGTNLYRFKALLSICLKVREEELFIKLVYYVPYALPVYVLDIEFLLISFLIIWEVRDSFFFNYYSS